MGDRPIRRRLNWGGKVNAVPTARHQLLAASLARAAPGQHKTILKALPAPSTLAGRVGVVSVHPIDNDGMATMKGIFQYKRGPLSLPLISMLYIRRFL